LQHGPWRTTESPWIFYIIANVWNRLYVHPCTNKCSGSSLWAGPAQSLDINWLKLPNEQLFLWVVL
jgi:hypothetical protein